MYEGHAIASLGSS